MGQTIRDTSPTLVAGHNTPRTFPSKQANLKSLSEFEVVVDVVVVVVVTAMVVVAVVVVLFDLRSRKPKILKEFASMRKTSTNSHPGVHSEPCHTLKTERFAKK